MAKDSQNGIADRGSETDVTGLLPLITISIPVFDEEDNVARLMERLRAVAEREQAGYRFEFLFTDNASTDRTFELLAELAEQDKRIRVLRLSRNFGFQKSILTNYLNAKGVAAVQIDADLQDPPEMISDFLRAWEQGYKVVYGIRKHRQEFFVLHGARRLYYRLLAWLSDVYVPADVGDFRLIDRVIIDQLREVREQTPYLRGLIASMGFAQKGIPYSRDTRKAGVTKFPLLHLIELGLDGITSQSTRPLRLITMFGFLISFLTVVGILVYLGIYIFAGSDLPGGFVTMVLLLLGSIGLNAFFLGFVGEYIGRVFNNNRGLPISIIEQRIEHPMGATDEGASMSARNGSTASEQHSEERS